MKIRSISTFVLLLLALGGCGDDDISPDSAVPMDGSVDTRMEEDGGPGPDAPDAALAEGRFVVRIENVSGGGPIPGPISPGVVIAHGEAGPLFTEGESDRGEGLEGIAEDGNPTVLATSLAGAVPFAIPDGGDMPAAAFPGAFYEVEVSVPAGESLSLATMFVQSNDIIIAPDEDGIAVYAADGSALPEQDVTDQLLLWDVGTEANEAPGAGPHQAPRQDAANTGAAEGVVRVFAGTTQALPAPSALIDVAVTETGGVFTVEITNAAPTSGTLLSPFAGTVWALHAEGTEMFSTGASAPAGLESLAEDGDGTAFAAALDGSADFAAAGTAGMGAIMGGDSVSFDVTPTAAASRLNFATMVVQTNDVFLALPPAGVDLFADGTARSAADVQAEIQQRLAIWDAGTEADQIPGAGPNQAPRQAAPNTGDADPNSMVRRHGDPTNRLADLSDEVSVTIVNSGAAGTFDVTVRSVGTETGFPVLTPVVWAVHSNPVLFSAGDAAGEGLERLAEDGDPMVMATALMANANVGTTGVQAVPIGGTEPGPAMPGAGYTFSVTPDAAHPNFSFGSMLVPSNDLFLAFGPEGVALLDDVGAPRSDAEIAASIAAGLSAWDAGTEQNQSGAGGSNQAPRQAAANTGEAEGDGTVRRVPDGVWGYPTAGQVVRVTIRPAD